MPCQRQTTAKKLMKLLFGTLEKMTIKVSCDTLVTYYISAILKKEKIILKQSRYLYGTYFW